MSPAPAQAQDSLARGFPRKDSAGGASNGDSSDASSAATDSPATSSLSSSTSSVTPASSEAGESSGDAGLGVLVGRLSFCGHPELHGTLCTSCGRNVLPAQENGRGEEEAGGGGGAGAGGGEREESGDTHQVLMKGGKMMSVTAEGEKGDVAAGDVEAFHWRWLCSWVFSYVYVPKGGLVRYMLPHRLCRPRGGRLLSRRGERSMQTLCCCRLTETAIMLPVVVLRSTPLVGYGGECEMLICCHSSTCVCC